ncbi:hypothetical protein [Solimicrobium silvestre]|uniref:DUF1453 domain-containing protein n=1 Tax=Solimicrobium silvestre TaxID=2099400 RepID=A0A2S9GU79_9BURK|nr:hypothetical protein [Solimicrobium silvestre]PRC91264.1 hypothetical protein S2091_4049 [Solimicrobium silvestre]
MTNNPQTLIFLAFIPLILWRMYSRIRRMVGRQVSKPWRQWLTVCSFPLLVLLIGAVSFSQPYALLALFGGLALGIAFGVIGHRLTKFEQSTEGMFYTPNAHLGIALSLLLIGRLMYRFIETGLPGSATAVPQNTLPTPLTLALFGMLAGYYVTYAIGLILWRRNAERNKLPENNLETF